MATWKCSSCGAKRGGRCKPRKCEKCGSTKGFAKAEKK